jgi:hypothetical protein
LDNYSKSAKDVAAATLVLTVIDNNAKNAFYTCDDAELPPTMAFLDDAINTAMSKGIPITDPRVQTLERMKAKLQWAIDKSKKQG